MWQGDCLVTPFAHRAVLGQKNLLTAVCKEEGAGRRVLAIVQRAMLRLLTVLGGLYPHLFAVGGSGVMF